MTEQADMPFGQRPVDCINYFLSVHQPIYREPPACCHSQHYGIWIRYITSHMLISLTIGIAMRKATDPNSFGSMVFYVKSSEWEDWLVRAHVSHEESLVNIQLQVLLSKTVHLPGQNIPSGGTCVWRFNGLLFLFSSVFWKIRWNHLLISLDSCSFLPIFSPLSASKWLSHDLGALNMWWPKGLNSVVNLNEHVFQIGLWLFHSCLECWFTWSEDPSCWI